MDILGVVKKTHFKERKAVGFSQNNAMQFGKVPTLKGGGAESRVKQKIAFPISKTIINRDTSRDTLWIWRDTDYKIVIQVVILCRFGVIQLFLK